MFKRRKTHGDDHRQEPAPPSTLEEIDARTTCYPQDAEAPPPVIGQPRTTVYRQAVRWNRGGYDTLN
ncbi:MAG: hypothetical protein AB1679_09455 [Actinomycetota bacterium]|jgi:hypothetical protein